MTAAIVGLVTRKRPPAQTPTSNGLRIGIPQEHNRLIVRHEGVDAQATWTPLAQDIRCFHDGLRKFIVDRLDTHHSNRCTPLREGCLVTVGEEERIPESLGRGLG